MNLGVSYQLYKDTDAGFQDGSDKEDDDTSVESDSRSVDDTDLAAGAILVPDFKNNSDQDDIFATPWGKEHYLNVHSCNHKYMHNTCMCTCRTAYMCSIDVCDE